MGSGAWGSGLRARLKVRGGIVGEGSFNGLTGEMSGSGSTVLITENQMEQKKWYIKWQLGLLSCP